MLNDEIAISRLSDKNNVGALANERGRRRCGLSDGLLLKAMLVLVEVGAALAGAVATLGQS